MAVCVLLSIGCWFTGRLWSSSREALSAVYRSARPLREAQRPCRAILLDRAITTLGFFGAPGEEGTERAHAANREL